MKGTRRFQSSLAADSGTGLLSNVPAEGLASTHNKEAHRAKEYLSAGVSVCGRPAGLSDDDSARVCCHGRTQRAADVHATRLRWVLARLGRQYRSHRATTTHQRGGEQWVAGVG